MDLILLEKIKELRCENNGITKIARLLNKSTDTIRKYLVYLGELSEIPKNVGGRKRKYNVDDNFFEKIDNEYNAYILGFIYADGCILERNQFSITVKRDDEYILEKINICMKSNFPIVRYSSKYDENHKATDKSSLRITSKKIIEDDIFREPKHIILRGKLYNGNSGYNLEYKKDDNSYLDIDEIISLINDFDPSGNGCNLSNNNFLNCLNDGGRQLSKSSASHTFIFYFDLKNSFIVSDRKKKKISQLLTKMFYIKYSLNKDNLDSIIVLFY
jgi:hypothetical protein